VPGRLTGTAGQNVTLEPAIAEAVNKQREIKRNYEALLKWTAHFAYGIMFLIENTKDDEFGVSSKRLFRNAYDDFKTEIYKFHNRPTCFLPPCLEFDEWLTAIKYRLDEVYYTDLLKREVKVEHVLKNLNDVIKPANDIKDRATMRIDEMRIKLGES
jgi:hypothetical protein